jgi:RNA polymerase sigma-70 factor (ECF subfamily)
MDDRLARAFFSSLPEWTRAAFDPSETARELAAALEGARVRWPNVEIDGEHFAERLGALAATTADAASPPGEADADHADAPVAATTALGGLHASDVYLALACEAGSTLAIAAFEGECFGQIDGIVKRSRSNGLHAEDVRQALREKLFVRGPDGGPGVSRYSGRGPLTAWFRVVASRAVLNLATRGPKDLAHAAEDGALVDHATEDDPELLHMRAMYERELRAAIPNAFAALTPQERVLLRQRFVDDLSLDQLAVARGVHRATAVRQLAAARAHLTEALRAELTKKLRISPDELRSVLRVVRSQFHLTLRKFLDDEGKDPG